MPAPEDLKKASFIEIHWNKKTKKPQEIGEPFGVQFNPLTLKVTYSNQLSGGDKSGAASRQFVGWGTTKLSLDLWFDVTAPSKNNIDDVRLLTKKIVDFMKPKEIEEEYKPPGVRFIWGNFMFDGIIESINENLEFFSEQGKPLRANISLNIGSQEIQFPEKPDSDKDTPGKTPMVQTKKGENMPEIASKNGIYDWKSAAMAAGIENPRMIPAGTMLDLVKIAKNVINRKPR